MTKNKTCQPHITDQLRGGHYQTFKKLVNIKTTSGDYAETNLIDGKTGTLNRPSTVIAKKFKAKIPTGANISKITVEYKHSKADYNSKSPNIGAPKISLYNGDKVLKYSTGNPMTHKGQAPTNTATKCTTTFNSGWDYNVINSQDFSVRIDYPTNANNNSGYVRLYYVQVKIYYTEADFGLNWQLISGQYNHDDYILDLTCSNSNLVSYIPTVTIDAPLGFSLKSYEGDGSLVAVSARTFAWTPALGKSKSSDNIRLVLNANITYSGSSTSYTGTFTAVESLQEHDATYNVTVIKDRPVDPTVDPDDTTPPAELVPEDTPISEDIIIQFIQDEKGYLEIQLTDEQFTQFTSNNSNYIYFIVTNEQGTTVTDRFIFPDTGKIMASRVTTNPFKVEIWPKPVYTDHIGRDTMKAKLVTQNPVS